MALSAVPSTRSSALKLILACDLAKVRPLTAEVKHFLAEHGAGEEEVAACELAMVEACNNAINYVGSEGKGKNIDVEVLCDDREMEFRVHDNTAGFDWPETVELPDPDKERGRGLFLISSIMDRVNYFRGKSKNCLVMQKDRGAKTAGKATMAVALTVEEANRRMLESEQVVRDMAEELSFCYESLSAIFRCSAELGRTNKLEEFTQRLLSDLAQITSADWFVLRLVLKEDDRLVAYSAAEEMPALAPLKFIGVAEGAGASVETEAAMTREDVWFDNINPLKPEDPLSKARPGSIGLVHPFFLGDSLIGTLTVAKDSGSTLFTAVQANVIHTFADFLGIQIVNARFTEDQVRTRLVSRELEIAKTIQRSLLPKTIPHLPGYGLAGFCESAHQVGGDFYDVLKIGDNSLLLIIADVMGKGIPAAMFAAILRSLLRAVPEWMNQPAALLGRVNRLLFEELSGVDMFITAQLVFVDGKERKMTAASAGHCPVMLLMDAEGSVKTVAPEGLPLGILPDTTFSNHTENLPRNCRILLYTDGLTEARNSGGEFFGQDRLVRWMKKGAERRQTAEELKADLAAELNEFQSSATLSDDQTFLIMAE